MWWMTWRAQVQQCVVGDVASTAHYVVNDVVSTGAHFHMWWMTWRKQVQCVVGDVASTAHFVVTDGFSTGALRGG
jgi:hypothetical protein